MAKEKGRPFNLPPVDELFFTEEERKDKHRKNIIDIPLLGEPYRPSSVTKHFELFACKYGFNIRFHELRHTHASVLIMEGQPIVAVSKRLGHKKVSTTLDIYSHLMPDQDDALAAKMGELFNKKRPEAAKFLEFRAPAGHHFEKTRAPIE